MNNILTDIKIEKVVLGNIIEEPNLLYQFAHRINLFLFSASKNRQIFSTIIELQQANKPIDKLILESCLLQKGLRLNDYLSEIIEDAISPSHFEDYLMILVELSVKRDFIAKFNKLVKLASESNQNIYQLREKAINEFNGLFIERFIEESKSDETFANLVQRVEDRFSKIKNGSLTGLMSSLSIINKAFGGWQNSDLLVVAGRPGMGKSAFMVQSVLDIALQRMSVGIFSLEMSSEQVTSRLITNYTGIPNSSILRKGLSEKELAIYNNFKDGLSQLKIHVDDTPNISIQNLRIKAKMMKMRYNISILFVDYLQLITYDNSQNREQEVSKISRTLKAIAKELDIPVVALAQLSRNVEQRLDKRPLLSDLRDSGAIEQDADSVMFLYRPEYYGIELWGEEYQGDHTTSQIEIIIAKNRHGGILSNRFKVDLATSSFLNLKQGNIC